MRRPRRRQPKGQATIESVMAVLLLSLIFFGLLQVAILYISQLVLEHAAFVTARSYAVGFSDGIVSRAKEVGTIGMAGHPRQPDIARGLSPLQLAELEPSLIAEHVQGEGVAVLHYEHWDTTSVILPNVEQDDTVPIHVRVYDFPLEMPMVDAYTTMDDVDLGATMRIHNHAAYYIEQ